MMMAKMIFLFFASVVLVQAISAQCCGRWGGCGSGYGYGGLRYGGFSYGGRGYGGFSYGGRGYGGWGYGSYGPSIGLASGLGASYGGSLDVTSTSYVPAVGLAVVSDNVYEGCVDVCGNLPLLGTVHIEGLFPTEGAGVVSYSCGDGCVGITAEGNYDIGFGLGYGADYEGYGFGGCGCNCVY